MNKNYQHLLCILKAFINEEIPENIDEVNWNELLRIAYIHSVDGIIGYMIKKYDMSQSSSIKEFAREICLTSIALFNKRSVLMERLIDNMRQRHIPHILFKGYVLKDYYPVPELRSYGDIDFVIRECDRAKVHNMMIELGYEIKNDWEPVYSYIKDIEYYEIHTCIMDIDIADKADHKAYFKKMWNYVVKTGEFSWQFTPEYHLIYLLTHIAKHVYASGAGIRMYMDIAVLIKHFGNYIDWNFIKEELCRINLYDFSCVALTAVSNWFDTRISMDIRTISSEVFEEFMTFTMEAGTFGYVNREKGTSVLRKEKNVETSVSRALVVLKRLFPKASDIEQRYTYLIGKHWLIPIAWIHRFFKTRDTWGKHSHEAHVIMSAASDEVIRLKKIQKDIGL